jgi:hypothetical protein
MTDKERKFAAVLLRMASEEFSNHGCNDLDSAVIKEVGFTDEEKLAFVTEMYRDNGDLEEALENGWVTAKRFHSMPDWWVMSFLARKLEQGS